MAVRFFYFDNDSADHIHSRDPTTSTPAICVPNADRRHPHGQPDE
jgi:hypothetical protein